MVNSHLKLKITFSLVVMALFDTSFLGRRFRQSHSGGSTISLTFIDMIAAFASFPGSAINLLILWHYSTIVDSDFRTRRLSYYLSVLLTTINLVRICLYKAATTTYRERLDIFLIQSCLYKFRKIIPFTLKDKLKSRSFNGYCFTKIFKHNFANQ